MISNVFLSTSTNFKLSYRLSTTSTDALFRLFSASTIGIDKSSEKSTAIVLSMTNSGYETNMLFWKLISIAYYPGMSYVATKSELLNYSV